MKWLCKFSTTSSLGPTSGTFTVEAETWEKANELASYHVVHNMPGRNGWYSLVVSVSDEMG